MDDNFFILDKNALTISSFEEESDEKLFWFAKTPQERIISLEFMRQMIYGYNPLTERLQRVLTIIEQP
jgi:hypothetical protein